MSKASETIKQYLTLDAEYDKRFEEFEKSNKTLIDSRHSCYEAIIDRARTLFATICKVCDERENKFNCYDYLATVLGIRFSNDELGFNARLGRIVEITDDTIEFSATERWAYGGYAEGSITFPIALLDRDLDNPSWINDMCDKAEQMKKDERLQREREQYEKLKAMFEGGAAE